MKKWFSGLILIFFTYNSCVAQRTKNQSGRKNIIKLNPLGIIPVRDIQSTLISYERVLNTNSSIQLNTIFNYINFVSLIKHVGGGLEFRRYIFPGNVAPQGVYGGAGIAVGTEKFKDRGDFYSSISREFSLKLIVGKQWISRNGIFDVNVGLKYINRQFIHVSSSAKTTVFIPALNFGLGYNF